MDVGAIAAAADVVDCHAFGGNFLEGFVGMLVVEQGGPVGGFVGLDFARGTVGVLEGGVGRVRADVYRGGISDIRL